MPHKSTFGEGGCRINALSQTPDAACLPDQGIELEGMEQPSLTEIRPLLLLDFPAEHVEISPRTALVGSGHPGVGEGEGEVVLAGANVLVALCAGVPIFFENPCVLREVVCEKLDERDATREHDLSMSDRRPGGVERFSPVHRDRARRMVPAGGPALVRIEEVHVNLA